MTLLPQIDAHAHIEAGIDPAELTALGCVVFAVTREAREWSLIRNRIDEMTIWGIGCHPGFSSEVANFPARRFTEAIQRSPLVGEVGLDARAKTPKRDQRRVFEQILEIVADSPRLVSIHSVGASTEVLDAVQATPQKAAILHWWRGSPKETSRAIELGCYFSLNGAELRRPKVLSLLPRERILTETDYPFTERSDRKANRPGAVTTIEAALEREWDADREAVRRQVWSNLGALVSATGCSALLPSGISKRLLAVPVD